MSFHQQVCLYRKLMASQSWSLKGCVCVRLLACVCAFIHIFYVCISTHGFASVGLWVFVCVCAVLYLCREYQHFHEGLCFQSNIILHFSFHFLPPIPSFSFPAFSLSHAASIFHTYIAHWSSIITTALLQDILAKYQTRFLVYRYSILFCRLK